MAISAEYLKLLAFLKHEEVFGPTPRQKRLDDIKEEADELVNYTSEANLKEETSDLICSLFAFAQENGWTIDELVQMNLDKLTERLKNGHYERTGEIFRRVEPTDKQG